MTKRRARRTILHPLFPLAPLAAMLAPIWAHAQAPAATQHNLERVEVTGTLIKRVDRETPSPVAVYTREDVRNGGFSTIEELLRGSSVIDTGSIGDGAASGFVSGISTISMRGLGSQATLTLVNGRRLAPVAAVDVNFGRANLINASSIPRAAVDRVEVLKDGASAMYGSDAMAGVVNYVLRKEYKGIETDVTLSANDRGKGQRKTASLAWGTGNLETQRFNVFGGIEFSRRDSVMFSDLKDRGDPTWYNALRVMNNTMERFSPDSAVSFYSSYYRLPTSLSGSTTIDGRSVANTNLSGANYLGTLPGCPDELTVGKGVPTRPPGFSSTAASLRTGACRFNLDNSDETISAQDRMSAMAHGTFQLTSDIRVTGDIMLSRVKTRELGGALALTTSLFTQAGSTSAATWPNRDGTLRSQRAIVLPVGHPDNPTTQPVQLIYRFEDLNRYRDTTVDSSRIMLGLEGTVAGWDVDAALIHSRTKGKDVNQARLRSSLLTSSITAGNTNFGVYRFGGTNDEAAKASVATRPVNLGDSKLTSLDMRASRELWTMAGGKAALGVGAEWRDETLAVMPDADLLSGDYISIVANSAQGGRKLLAGFGELSLPVLKNLELQAAMRGEKYSDFGDATTGKLGFKWAAVPSKLAFRGTAATGFRAPSIPQIHQSFVSSFHSHQQWRVFDDLRCDKTTNRTLNSPTVNANNVRDCNVLAFSNVPTGEGSTSLATVISANAGLKPERSKSATFGVLFSPADSVDVVLDAWYFHRSDEIRLQRGADVMEQANQSPSTPHPQVIRDPNQANWLKDAQGNVIPNSGPILMLTRAYENVQWTKTAGLDYDITFRLPVTTLGRFSVNVNGTATQRFDRIVAPGGSIERLVGTSTTDLPRTRARITLNWRKNEWAGWMRFNHADPVSSTVCGAYNAAAQAVLNDARRCRVTIERTLDVGGSWKGKNGLSVSLSILNLMNDYNRSEGIPSAFTYWDPGREVALGRRLQMNVNYQF